MTDQHLAWAKTVSALAVCGDRTIHAPDVDRTSSPTAAIETTVGVRLPPGSESLGADALRGDG
jgi:hypothetical protein